MGKNMKKVCLFGNVLLKTGIRLGSQVQIQQRCLNNIRIRLMVKVCSASIGTSMVTNCKSGAAMETSKTTSELNFFFCRATSGTMSKIRSTKNATLIRQSSNNTSTTWRLKYMLKTIISILINFSIVPSVGKQHFIKPKLIQVILSG